VGDDEDDRCAEDRRARRACPRSLPTSSALTGFPL
jgi:hypothetical protein